MIPKKIHYCWLSGDPFPADIEQYLSTWRTTLPDYEFILWDKSKFDIETTPWVKEAFEARKYAFAADYIRLYALYNEGGIYLDTDIEVVKSFNDLLHLPYVLGTEGGGLIEAGVMMSSPREEWARICLDYYDNRHFRKENGSFDTLPLPRIIDLQLSKRFEMRPIHSVPQSYSDKNVIYYLPKEYFSAKDAETGIVTKTTNTYSVHHFAGSWLPRHSPKMILYRIKLHLIKIIGAKVILTLIRILRLREIRQAVSGKGAK